MELNILKAIGGLVFATVLIGVVVMKTGLAADEESVAPPIELIPAEAKEKPTTDADVVLVGDKPDADGGAEAEAAKSTNGEPSETAPPAPAPDEPAPAEPAPLNEAPFVVSAVPSDGAAGVSPDADIVVTFSEPMDKIATQAALGLSTGNCGEFSWSDDATVMTFDPCAGWEYDTEVELVIDQDAADPLGLGMLDAYESGFTVLRQSTIKLWSEDAYDGHVLAPGVFVLGDKAVAAGQYFTVGTWSRGFLSFDLSELPQDLVDIQDASLSVKQDSHQAGAYGNGTGSLLIESVAYGTLTAGDWGLAAIFDCAFCLIQVLGTDASDGWKSAGVAGYVRDDWENREARDYNSQFRLRFAKDCGDGQCASISATFIAGKGNGVVRPYLYITYTHP